MEKPAHFFPERMAYVEIIAPVQSCYNIVKRIAERGTMQIIDSNENNIQTPRRHTDTFIMCEDSDRCLNYIEKNLKDEELFPPPPNESDIPIMINDLNLAQIAERLHNVDHELKEKVQVYNDLKKQIQDDQYKLRVLQYFKPIVNQQQPINVDSGQDDSNSLELSMINDNNHQNLLLSVCGLSPTTKVQKLSRTVYRVSRRNAIFHIGETSDDMIPYAIFVSSPALQQKVQKICESYSPYVYNFQSESSNLYQQIQQVQDHLNQSLDIIRQTADSNRNFLTEISHSYWPWRIFITKEKQIWQAVDYGDFNSADSSVIYQAWTPKRFTHDLIPDLQNASVEGGSPVPIQVDISDPSDHPNSVVPTFIEKNEFTRSFQILNNAYGIPNYDELNGGAFYCMYPFLFGVMFGDIGHSIFYILAAIALLVIDPIRKKKRWNLGDIGGSIFGFKWLLFFCAICAFYCGFIYNECFGLPFSTFQSNWELDVNASTSTFQKWKQKNDNKIYPFGIDHQWYFKDNELIFMNSYKMKLAVVLGMSQMIFGMFLQLVNHIYRKNYLDIAIWWLPQMLYLIPFFGYIVVLIIVKWCTKFEGNDFYPVEQQNEGVNLIQTIIAIIINAGSKDPTLHLYKGQWGVQAVILVLFIVSIVLLLILRPIFTCIKRRGDKSFTKASLIEAFVMNLIEVIEFCLGALSHTASYLRLWALSLAHSQLSHVVYDELFILTLNKNNVFLVFIGFAAFAAMTAAILLAMEAFSALLHAIRLMWVEFSSKFYAGMGVSFKPVSFKKALKKIGVTM